MNSNTADVFNSLVDTLDKFSTNNAVSDNLVLYERTDLPLPYRVRFYTGIGLHSTKDQRRDRIAEHVNRISRWVNQTYGPEYPHVYVLRKPTGLKVCFEKESDRSLFVLKWS